MRKWLRNAHLAVAFILGDDWRKRVEWKCDSRGQTWSNFIADYFISQLLIEFCAFNGHRLTQHLDKPLKQTPKWWYHISRMYFADFTAGVPRRVVSSVSPERWARHFSTCRRCDSFFIQAWARISIEAIPFVTVHNSCPNCFQTQCGKLRSADEWNHEN